MRILSTLIAGLIFGTGLILSGMANPIKVQNFLDFFGNWDPLLKLDLGPNYQRNPENFELLPDLPFLTILNQFQKLIRL